MIVTLAQHADSSIARDLLVILAIAGVVGLMLRRLRLAVIPGYLLAGAIIGPHALRMVTEPGTVQSITQVATILLMFTLGLHMDLTRMRGSLRLIAFLTAAATLLTAVLCWPLLLAVGLKAPAALAVALAWTVSSTAVVIRVLMQRGELDQVYGRISFGVLVFQDLLAMVLLAALPAIAHWQHGGTDAARPDPTRLLTSASLAIGAVAAMIVLGRLILPRVLREAAGDGGGEVLLVVSSAVALGAAALTSVVGLSAELGAFLAGFLLAGTTFRYQLAGQLVPMRDLFMAVFFTVVGMDVPLGVVADRWRELGLLTLGLIVIKALATAGCAWALGITPAVAALTGMALAQGGEFSLVMLSQAHAQALTSQSEHGLMVSAIVLSLMVTPMMMGRAHAVGHWAAKLRPAPWARRASHLVERVREPVTGDGTATTESPGDAPTPDRPGHVIVAGFGPVGAAVADELERHKIPIFIIDMNPRTITKQTAMGRRIVFGDAGNADVLETAGLAHAQALVLTMPDEDACIRACRSARSIKPDIFIAARAIYLVRALRLMQEGADHTVVEEMATAEAMAEQVMIKLRMRAEGADSTPKLYELGA